MRDNRLGAAFLPLLPWAGVSLTGFLGRRDEREVVARLLSDARRGRSGVLVVRGEAGIGKTALLEQARDEAIAGGFQAIECAGIEAETQFAFAGLQRLCADRLGGLPELPDVQQVALGVAFGLRAGAPPDRFLVGLAVLGLLAEAAAGQPLITLVDDAQWLDQASADVLAFVARRLEAEGVLIVFAIRSEDGSDLAPDDPFVGLVPELRLTGLGETDARTLLGASVQAPMDGDVRDRILAEARGNPLALLELPSSAALAGGFGLPNTQLVPRRVEEGFRRRSGDLPRETQSMLLLAAADPTGDVALLQRAAALFGVAPEAVEPAEASGLLDVGSRVRFRHPLVRSAVYRAATPGDRRRAHGVLADATDPIAHADRRAWHRAQAVLGTDEAVASELERSAGRTRARGGLAAAAAFLERSMELTPDAARRAERALAAAYAKHDAGASEVALELLSEASVGPLDTLQRARRDLLRARIGLHLTNDPDAPRMLLEVAETFTVLGARQARETYLSALDAALVVGTGVMEVARAARAAPALVGPPSAADLLLDGLVTAFTTGFGEAVPILRRALAALREERPPSPLDAGASVEAPTAPASNEGRRWLWLPSGVAAGVFDEESMFDVASRNVRIARDTGSLSILPAALVGLSAVTVLRGDLARAAELADASAAITRATGAVPLRYGRIFVAAWQGDGEAIDELRLGEAGDGAGTVVGAELSLAHYANAVLRNGLGEYGAAADAAARACLSDELSNTSLALPEFIEGATRSDQSALAMSALAALRERAEASGTEWGLGLAAGSGALLAHGAEADALYREAIDRLSRGRMVLHLARAHLVYGEWLRREGRRLDARKQLRIAHDTLADSGAVAFAARAARELRATGEQPRARSAPSSGALTEHELQIARLVAAGATSREVGAQLFLSTRTIEAHLRNIFPKLGITSRRQLRDHLPQ
ncbi:helix-turn-helix transcriptional regulator [Labedella endophytica]|uniref:Helix-turn-helix transcriptional regulator n=1 Tax=Labedella endophytica TaxID=1523160 RepID=A0A3S0X8G5_9MICO|nr:LuxR family transcriptional regulator [Labedella endophytica]RUQ98143.1 helix-turn-helix transcriptional regulator [Labedella endophytica]